MIYNHTTQGADGSPLNRRTAVLNRGRNMSRLRYIIKRILVAIPTFFGITLLVYILASMTPSSPLEIMFNDPMATKEQMEAMEKSLGLDQPVYIQYFRWLIQLLQGNLGTSYRTGLPVMGMVLERIGPTLLLTGSAMLLTVIIALPLGIMAAYKPYSGWDYISSGISFIGAALPNFFAALVLIYIFNVKLKIFPSTGMYDSSGVKTGAMCCIIWFCLPACCGQYIGSRSASAAAPCWKCCKAITCEPRAPRACWKRRC